MAHERGQARLSSGRSEPMADRRLDRRLHDADGRRVLDEQGLHGLLRPAGERHSPGSSPSASCSCSITMVGWWRDVIRESVVLRDHTPVVKLRPALRHGAVHRLGSDVLRRVVLGLFQHARSSTTTSRIGSWPPSGIVTLDPWHFPLLNTLILLTSGTTVTWAHHALQHGDRKGAIQGLILTVLLGASFTCVQAYEYAHAPFTFGFNNLRAGAVHRSRAHAISRPASAISTPSTARPSSWRRASTASMSSSARSS